MLVHLDVEIDDAALGDRHDDALQAERIATETLGERGIAIAEWHKAGTRGVIAIREIQGHDAQAALLRWLRSAPRRSKVAMPPLVDHPLCPGGWLKPT